MKKSYWLHVRGYKGAMPGMQPQYGIIFTMTPMQTGVGGASPQALYPSWDHIAHALGVLGCESEVANTKKALEEQGGHLIQNIYLDDDQLRAVGVELPHPVA